MIKRQDKKLHFHLRNKELSLLILFFICILFHQTVTSQDSSIYTLPLIQKAGSEASSFENNITNSDFDKVNLIYNKLVRARGDFRYPVPKLFLRKEEARVASIDYEKMEIIIEEKAYKICQPFGDAAVAFLLAHELTHYYEKHAWKSGFAADYSDLSIGKKIKATQDQVANETQADYLGGFLAYSAGYGMFDKSSEILKQLYASYNIAELIPGYPSLTERIELAKRSASKLRSLVEVFEMANLLAATGNYREAFSYYNYILLHYQSRELYNNIGFTALLNALQYFTQKELKFRYAVELDLETQSSRDVESVKLRDSILKVAVRNFDAAIGMDPDYAPAYLNKATALALLGDKIRAQFYAEQEAYPIAVKNNFPKTASDANILLGIIFASSGDSLHAEELFSKAASAGSNLAKLNLDILHLNKSTDQKTSRNNPTELVTMDHTDLQTFSKDPAYNKEKVVAINSEFAFLQYSEDSLNFNIYYNLNTDSRDINYFMLTKSDSKAKTEKNISNGSSRNDVEKNYGTPSQIIESVQGSILIYDKILFFIGKENTVVRWGSYLNKKSLL